MATRTSQRVGIWIIAIVMTVGTLGAFFLPILVNDNASKEAEQQQQALDLYKKQLAEQQKSNAPLPGYEATPFNKTDISSLTKEIIKEGSGAEATPASKVTANYFGWTSDGTIFDTTNKDGSVTPVDFPLDQVIKGWTEGLSGLKEGTVVKLLIPADKAYGAQGNSTIGPNEPLAFVVELVKVQ